VENARHGTIAVVASLANEIRLVVTISVTAWVVVAAWRFARRRVGNDFTSNASDALLALYLVQYVSIGAIGLPGVLSPGAMLGIACAIAAVLWFTAGRAADPSPPQTPHPSSDSLVLLVCLVLSIAYVAGIISLQYPLPPVANDALTYHLPAAVDWMQHGRLTLYQAWLFNPANTYSPLAGSMFVYWLMAPLGNDVLARFVQAPALLLIFVALADLCRGLGAPAKTAAVLATAAVLSRPLFSQTLLTKDDLFVTAFFTAALAGLAPDRLRDRLGPWRVGVALGLLLSTKYTALMSLPIVLLALDAPARAGWRLGRWTICIGLTLVLAGPWFLRNWLLTGNPLYPIDTLLFDGMFRTVASEKLSTVAGIQTALSEGYFSLPPAAWIVLGLTWLGALMTLGREILPQPLVRATLIGPPLGIGLFLLLSPYDEIRFIYPCLVLLFACTALSLRKAPLAAQVAVALVLLGISMSTNFKLQRLAEILPHVAVIFAVLLGLGVALLTVRQRMTRIAGAALMGVIVVGWVFVHWHAYVTAQRTVSTEFWANQQLSAYAPLGQAWRFVRDDLPPDATLAYANTFYVYPLYGFDLNRKVLYAPMRARVRHIHDLMRITEPLSGERIVPAVVRQTGLNSDQRAWISNLRNQGVRYVLIAKADLTGSTEPEAPIELTFAEQSPKQFRRIFENDSAAVYELLP
jgi:hypothetical protein